MTTFPIHERFFTFQGEGMFMGVPAYFVRSFGCPVKCPWCDSAGTWHPTYVPAGVERLSAMQIFKAAVDAGSPLIVVTGGEPAIHDWRPLLDVARWAPKGMDGGTSVHLETSGAFPIHGMFDWVTLSPKRWKLPLAENLVEKADEIKIIVEGPQDIEFYSEVLSKAGVDMSCPHIPIWLHPEWGRRADPVVLSVIKNAVKSGRGVFRAGWQIHKLYLADQDDPKSRPAVPLGGDPKRGF